MSWNSKRDSAICLLRSTLHSRLGYPPLFYHQRNNHDPTNAPLAALPLALVRDSLLGCDRDTLRGACSRPHWVVTAEDWYAGYTFPRSPAASQIPVTWQLQEAGNCGQLKMTGLVKYLSKRLMPLCFSPPVVPHPWQTDLPLPPKVVIDITFPGNCKAQIDGKWCRGMDESG